MRRARADPRRRTLWLDAEKFSQLAVKDLPSNISVALGVETLGPGKTQLRVAIEIEGEASAFSVKHIAVAVAEAARRNLAEAAASSALLKLGVLDTPATLPRPPFPRGKEFYATWVRLGDKGIELGTWFHFDVKDVVRSVFKTVVQKDSNFGELHALGRISTPVWHPENKMWSFMHETAFPEFLSQLREKGFSLRWLAREGFPPPPALLKLEEEA